jgi:prepilin-type N-terminal cleavage/methylation domain-containing protein
MRFLRQLLGGGEEGYTLVELIVVMAILGTVVAGLTTVFVSGSAAEIDLNLRYQAQQQARLGLNQIRSDVHCASAAQAQTIGTYPGLKLAVGNCYSTTPTISWCVVPVTTTPARYAVYRSTATSNICTTSDTMRKLIADYLTTSTGVFTTGAIARYALQTVAVDFKISANATTTKDVYELTDSVVARNAPRCYTVGGCATPTVS